MNENEPVYPLTVVSDARVIDPQIVRLGDVPVDNDTALPTINVKSKQIMFPLKVTLYGPA
jgi:hypothetical protein